MDTAFGLRDTLCVLGPGARRHRLAKTLNAAYAEGLLSERTLSYRLDALFAGVLIDPARLVGDLNRRGPRRSLGEAAIAPLAALRRRSRAGAGRHESEPDVLLALDWTGACEQFVIGRHPACELVMSDPTVSRRHAQLRFRDGAWIVQDLDSTNGTRLNGQRIGRSRLRPGDRLALGDLRLQVD